MAIAIGIFDNASVVAGAVLRLREAGIAKQNVARMVLQDKDEHSRQRVAVSGYLKPAANEGEIRTLEEGIYVALEGEHAYTAEMIQWLAHVTPGSNIVIVRADSEEAPWIAEILRRAGAVFALDSESQSELLYFAQQHDRHGMPV